MLITAEGYDGSGKTTLLRNLYNALSRKYKVFCSREPGGTDVGIRIREIILHGHKGKGLDPYAELFLMLADRHQHISYLKDKLLYYDIILCDRYYDSTIAYQEFGNEIAILHCLEELPPIFLHRNFIPNLTFYLQISYETALKRMEKRGEKLSHFEKRGREYFERVVLGYETQAKLYPWRIKIINGEQDERAILSDCLWHIPLEK